MGVDRGMGVETEGGTEGHREIEKQRERESGEGAIPNNNHNKFRRVEEKKKRRRKEKKKKKRKKKATYLGVHPIYGTTNSVVIWVFCLFLFFNYSCPPVPPISLLEFHVPSVNRIGSLTSRLRNNTVYTLQHSQHTAYTLQHTAYTLQHTAYTLQHTTAHSIHTTTYSIHTTAHSIHTIAYSIHTTAHSMHTTAYSIHTTAHSIHTTTYSIHSGGGGALSPRTHALSCTPQTESAR